MNLIEILNNSILLEAVRINNGKEAYELIKSNKIGVKLDPSYKVAGNDIIPYFDKVINDVGANNAPFAIQLLANKVPTESLNKVASSNYFKEIVACKNKPWAKQIPGYREAIDFSNKEKFDQSRWSSLGETLKNESQNHGKANKGSGNSRDVKELYNDGVWTLQVPTSWEGAKYASYYGKRGETPTPAQWCTRADKRYYDMYTKNSPLYIIRNMETGDAYQIAFDKLNAYVLDKNDSKGDKFTQGDLNGVPDKLLKFIKWNGRSLADFKKEFNRTELRKGELKNPQTDFKDAEWESPKNEVDGIVSQVMHNLHSSEKNDNFTTFMVNGKSFKFDKRNNYAKKYYYKNKPNLIVVAVLSNNGDIKKDILWPLLVSDGSLKRLSVEEFNKAVGDNGFLFNKVKNIKDTADQKRENRNVNNSKKGTEFLNKMATLLSDHIKKVYVEDGLIEKENTVGVGTYGRNKRLDSKREEVFGNFMPYKFSVEIYANNNNDYIGEMEFIQENFKCKIVELHELDFSDSLTKQVEESTNKALKSFAKEAIHDKYGRDKRIEYREKSRGVAAYDTNSSRRLQFEDYFPY